MSDVDQIAAVLATLEMVSADNEGLIEQFQEVKEKLNVIENMPPGIRSVQFRQLEQSGAFEFNNVDIRHFSAHTKKPLTPPQFVERTSRRLHNTETLIGKFLAHEEFEGGKELQASLETLNSEIVDRNDQAAVIKFKKKVEALRDTPLFKNYMAVRKGFLAGNQELKDEADLLAAKETVADGEMVAKDRQDEIKKLESALDSGEVSPEEAQTKLDAMEMQTEPEAAQAAASPTPAKPAAKDDGKAESAAKPAEQSAAKDDGKAESAAKPAEQTAAKDDAKAESTEKPAEQTAAKDDGKAESAEKPAEQTAGKDDGKAESTEKPAD